MAKFPFEKGFQGKLEEKRGNFGVKLPYPSPPCAFGRIYTHGYQGHTTQLVGQRRFMLDKKFLRLSFLPFQKISVAKFSEYSSGQS